MEVSAESVTTDAARDAAIRDATLCPQAAGEDDVNGRGTMLCRPTPPATPAAIDLCSTCSRCDPIDLSSLLRASC
jgi:hypothetical protein